MKPQKTEWRKKISQIEASQVRYLRAGLLVRIFCSALCFLAIIGGIGVTGLAGYEALVNIDSATSTREYVYTTVLCGIVAAVMIALDFFVSDPLLKKAFELGDQAYHLKKHGWNKHKGAPASCRKKH